MDRFRMMLAMQPTLSESFAGGTPGSCIRKEEAVVVCSCPCYSTSHLFRLKGVRYRRTDIPWTTVGKMVRCVSVPDLSTIDWDLALSVADQYVSSKDVMEKGIITCGSTGAGTRSSG